MKVIWKRLLIRVGYRAAQRRVSLQRCIVVVAADRERVACWWLDCFFTIDSMGWSIACFLAVMSQADRQPTRETRRPAVTSNFEIYRTNGRAKMKYVCYFQLSRCIQLLVNLLYSFVSESIQILKSTKMPSVSFCPTRSWAIQEGKAMPSSALSWKKAYVFMFIASSDERGNETH